MALSLCALHTQHTPHYRNTPLLIMWQPTMIHDILLLGAMSTCLVVSNAVTTETMDLLTAEQNTRSTYPTSQGGTEENYNNVDGNGFDDRDDRPLTDEDKAGKTDMPHETPRPTSPQESFPTYSSSFAPRPFTTTTEFSLPSYSPPPTSHSQPDFLSTSRPLFEPSYTEPKEVPPQPVPTKQAPPEDRTYPEEPHETDHKWMTPDKSTSTREKAFCDFGVFPEATLCEWKNGANASLVWQPGTGNGANWLGGPWKDFNAKSSDGGYVFVETSQPPDKSETKFKHPGAMLESPILGSTGASGTCFRFAFAIKGLSPSGFKVILQEVEFGDNSVKSGHKSAHLEEQVLWQAQYHSQGSWQEASILYTMQSPHKLVLVGEPAEPTNPSRSYRGYIAVDMLNLASGSECNGFCTFAAGFCDWSNEEGDEFDWSLSRGSSNPVTGPTMDSSANALSAGSYTFIDSDFPRRPGDIARLVSPIFPNTGPDSPQCMRFWFHMFGPAVGSLRVLLRRPRHDAFFPHQLWSLSGSAGNAWFMGQVTISSLQEYQIILEASVGNTAMSDIAVDDITFTQGPCPVAPQVADISSGDCTFEVDECGWTDSGSKDTVHWERLPGRTQKPWNRRPPLFDSHAANNKNEYFLGVGRRSSPHMTGRARLASRTFAGSTQPRCLTFWYLMSEPFIDVSGSSLGAVQVFLKTDRDPSRPLHTPLWQLYNNQFVTWRFAQIPIKEANNFSIMFEGSWGPNRASGSIAIDDIAFYNGDCAIHPAEARVRVEDCSFEVGLCGWHNWTRSRGDGSSGALVAWQQAVDTHRPALLRDNTFGTTDGYIFFDIFTTNQKESAVMLTSSSIKMRENENDEALCFTFWYAAFGAGESTHLLVLRTKILDEPDSSTRETLWQLTPERVDTSRPVWTPGQVSVDTRSPFKLVLEGRGSNGGFAIDDIRLMPGACKIRPMDAEPKK